MITFLLCGIWHGAGLTFIVWGILHGFAMIMHRAWKKFSLSMPRALAWFITFNFVNFAWVFFRADSFHDAWKVLKGMAGINGFSLPVAMVRKFGPLSDYGINFAPWQTTFLNWKTALVFILILLVTFLFRNSNEFCLHFKPNTAYAVMFAAASFYLVLAVLKLQKASTFIYFQF